MKGRLVGGILLVTGTTVGAGMLALPVLTGLGGFYPSLILFALCWLFTVYSAFLILEINLWFDGEVNMVSMARHLLGKWGAFATWLVYLLLLYSLTAAYIAGGGPLLASGITAVTGIDLPVWSQPFPFLLIFGIFIYCGTRSVDLVNRFFMIGLILSYGFLLFWITPYVQTKQLLYRQWDHAYLALPVVVASFGFQMIIPSLTHYLQRDVKVLRRVIWWGTGLPFAIYVIWEWATLGVIPLEGPVSLTGAFAAGLPATYPMANIVKNSKISNSANFFAFFSVVTSFLGSALSLSGFLIDGMNLSNSFTGKLKTIFYTFTPPLIFVLLYPRGFIMALEYAGVFFALLLQIMPALMIWKGRYRVPMNSSYRVRGGKPLLILFVLYSLAVITVKAVETKSLAQIANEKALSFSEG